MSKKSCKCRCPSSSRKDRYTGEKRESKSAEEFEAWLAEEEMKARKEKDKHSGRRFTSDINTIEKYREWKEQEDRRKKKEEERKR